MPDNNLPHPPLPEPFQDQPTPILPDIVHEQPAPKFTGQGGGTDVQLQQIPPLKPSPPGPPAFVEVKVGAGWIIINNSGNLIKIKASSVGGYWDGGRKRTNVIIDGQSHLINCPLHEFDKAMEEWEDELNHREDTWSERTTKERKDLTTEDTEDTEIN